LGPGDQGWIPETELLPLITVDPPIRSDQRGACI
jgi:hypothetical protein